MLTQGAIRARLRNRLEDGGTASLWTDAELDEAIAATLEEYSHLFPREDRAELTVGAGARSVAGPVDTFEVLRVVLATGATLPRRSSPHGNTTGEVLAWEWFAGTLHFSRPLPAQTLEVWRLTGYTLAQVPEADAGLLVLGGVWRALQQRSVQDLKRGGPLGGLSYAGTIRSAEREYTRALNRRGRRVRARVMGV